MFDAFPPAPAPTLTMPAAATASVPALTTSAPAPAPALATSAGTAYSAVTPAHRAMESPFPPQVHPSPALRQGCHCRCHRHRFCRARRSTKFYLSTICLAAALAPSPCRVRHGMPLCFHLEARREGPPQAGRLDPHHFSRVLRHVFASVQKHAVDLQHNLTGFGRSLCQRDARTVSHRKPRCPTLSKVVTKPLTHIPRQR